MSNFVSKCGNKAIEIFLSKAIKMLSIALEQPSLLLLLF